MDPINPNKFTPNKSKFKPDSKYNPGIKSDKGRIILIVIAVVALWWIYTEALMPFIESLSKSVN